MARLPGAGTELIAKLQDFFATRREILFAYLFGSLAQGTANRYSDMDIAVYLAEPEKAADLEWYLTLKTDLMLLARREVDVVILNTAKPLVKHAVNQGKIALLSRDKLFESEYVLRVIREYNDVRRWSNLSNRRRLRGEGDGQA